MNSPTTTPVGSLISTKSPMGYAKSDGFLALSGKRRIRKSNEDWWFLEQDSHRLIIIW